MAGVLGVVAAGVAVAVGCDALVGPVDGEPAAYLLIVLALPLWGALPVRVGERVWVLAAVWCAVAGVWYLLALAAHAPWWRGEGAYAVACLAVGWAAVVGGRWRRELRGARS